jgi:hypothetical protein
MTRDHDLGERALGDLEIRRRVLTGGTGPVPVPRQDLPFWRAYGALVAGGAAEFSDDGVDHPRFPEPNGRAALWYSGGVESTYTKLVLDEPVDLLHIEDFALFDTPHRKLGQVHFLCALIAADLGYSRTYLGMERDDFLVTAAPSSWPYAERHPRFAAVWTEHREGNAVLTLCGDMEKEEIIRELADRGVRVEGTCDRLKDGRWCGECYKCFEAFYFARAAGVDLGISLRRSACTRYYDSYERYLRSGFTDSFNNSYHRFARLQMRHQIAVDPERDCVDDR